MATESQEAAARAAASAIVESELRGPIAYVAGATARLRTDDSGVVLLPFQPAFNVTQVVYDSGQVQDLTTVLVDGQWVSGLARVAWVTITYDHGWTELTVPKIVRVIVDNLEQRLISSSGPTLKSEKIGGYEVAYDTDVGWLTDVECKALARVRRTTSGTSASADTSTNAPDYGPFGVSDWWWDE
jgi:hypothetical protein